MKNLTTIIHWLSYAYCVYVWGYASLFKVFKKTSMMESMQSLGFNRTATVFIGYTELIGLLMLLVGVFKPPVKIVGVLFLLPFAIGAFTAHMAHREYQHFWNALLMCLLSVVILWTDKHFTVRIR